MTTASSDWYSFESGAGDPAFNMALDEALLEAMPRLRQPVLRFYGWTQKAASFGYFQKYAQVELLTSLRPLVRRPTGGGIVPHDNDWTYSLVFPTTHDWYGFAATESYRHVHQAICDAFARLDVQTEVAPMARKAQPGQCFAGHERSDLLWRGQKIAGAAQRRRRDGLLIQGSVQPPPLSFQDNGWRQAFRDALSSVYGAQWSEYHLDEVLMDRALELARDKYSLASYNQGR